MNSKPSKSARKREQLALQALGERLIRLSESELAGLLLDEPLFGAVMAARTITSHGALRRQKQLIGKLMRGVDPEPIAAALEHLYGDERLKKSLFRRAEQWRERIVVGGDAALAEFRGLLGRDSAPVQDAYRQYRDARDERARKSAARHLFRVIHDEIGAGMHGAAHSG